MKKAQNKKKFKKKFRYRKKSKVDYDLNTEI